MPSSKFTKFTEFTDLLAEIGCLATGREVLIASCRRQLTWAGSLCPTGTYRCCSRSYYRRVIRVRGQRCSVCGVQTLRAFACLTWLVSRWCRPALSDRFFYSPAR